MEKDIIMEFVLTEEDYLKYCMYNFHKHMTSFVIFFLIFMVIWMYPDITS
jgi:hypothetical protein